MFRLPAGAYRTAAACLLIAGLAIVTLADVKAGPGRSIVVEDALPPFEFSVPSTPTA